MLRSGIGRVGLAALVIVLSATACIALPDGGLADLLRERRGNAAAPVAGAPQPMRIVEIPPANGRPAPIALDLAMMRKAVRRGELEVQLADGTYYPLRIEAERSDFGGRSTFVGKVQTRTGLQSAVLTFGEDAVFGVLPMPDGRKLSVSTTNGIVGVALAGGIIPPGMEDHAVSDVVLSRPDGKVRANTIEDISAAVLAAPVAPFGRGTSTRGVAQAVGEPMADVRIDVLGLFGDDLIAYRGSASAAETEVISMVAIATQAHVDSGSRVRFNVAATRRISFPQDRYSGALLDDLYTNQIAGMDVPSARDAAGADLVFILHNYVPGDPACGIGFLASSQGLSNVNDDFAYSVSGTGLCGPYTVAHELGHNLGAMHDRATSTIAGNPAYGAYSYSFGYRACVGDDDDGFATIMAYQTGGDCNKERLGYFSTPSLQACFGVACGEAGRADNVRGFNRIATAVAAYRDRPGSLSIADIEDIEPRSGETRWVSVPIRLTGIAPEGGITIKARIVGGTAMPGLDYEAGPETALTIPAGERSATLLIAILPDDAIEGDETILVRISADVDVARADGVVTIDDDDPRMMIRGAMRFSPGSEPAVPIPMNVYSADGFNDYYSIEVAPPDFRYEIPAVAGFSVTLQAEPGAPYAPLPLQVGQVDTDVQRNYDIPLGARVSGRLLVPQGGPVPQQPIEVEAITEAQGRVMFASSWMLMPGEAFDYLASPGTKVTIKAPPSAPYVAYRKVLDRINGDLSSDIVLSTIPSMSVTSTSDAFDEGEIGYAGGHAVVTFELSAPAPKQGVTFHYAVVPGSAKSGEDYVPVGGILRIDEGGMMESALVHLIDDTRPEDDEDFFVEVDGVDGAVVENPRARVIVRDDDRPAPPPPAIALSGESRQNEGDVGARNARRAVMRLSAPAPEAGIVIAYHTLSGTATAGEDFIPVDGRLTFAPGETEGGIDIVTVGDDDVEPDEYFDFVVEPIRGATLASPSPLRFVLVNDDQLTPPEPPGDGPAPGDSPDDGGPPPWEPPSNDPSPPTSPPDDDTQHCAAAPKGTVRLGPPGLRACH